MPNGGHISIPTDAIIARGEEMNKLRAERNQLRDAAEELLTMLCECCIRLNPQHEDEYRKGECRCEDTDRARLLLDEV